MVSGTVCFREALRAAQEGAEVSFRLEGLTYLLYSPIGLYLDLLKH